MIKIVFVLDQFPDNQSKSRLLLSTERLKNWDTFKHELTTLCVAGSIGVSGMHSMLNGYSPPYIDAVGPKGAGKQCRRSDNAADKEGPVECFTYGYGGM